MGSEEGAVEAPKIFEAAKREEKQDNKQFARKIGARRMPNALS